jgi:flagellar biosynthesis GTPase FlhF
MDKATIIDLEKTKQAAQKELTQRARAIAREQRKVILTALSEKELVVYLEELFKAMEPDYVVEPADKDSESVTDMVIVKRDSMTEDIVGVLVKRGNIMSKTLEDVNTLVSGVNRVFEIRVDRNLLESTREGASDSAGARGASNRVLINKVFVVLTGSISNRGTTLLAKNSVGPVDVFDIEWLTEHFTEFYPQVFYEGRITDFIQSKIQELETKSWRNKESMNLSQCFVEPLVRSMDVPLTIDDAKLAAAMTTRRLPFSKLRSVVSSKQKVILIGDPGTGKSAALAKLAIEILRQSYNSLTKSTKARGKAEIPLLFGAKDILELNDVHELRSSYFGNEELAGRVNSSVLMVDALDEVPSQQREEVVLRSMKFSQLLDCALIITSRKIDFLSSTPSGCKKYELLPFEASQALKLFEKIHGKDQLLQTLRGELNKIRFQIPMVPLSLLLLLELVEEKSEVPASLTELYERYTDMVLGKHDKRKGIEVLFEYTVKKRFLATLAYNEFLNKGRLEIPLSEYLRFLDEYAAEYSLEKHYIDQFVKEIERAGVLHVNEAEVMFGHRSFLDYFAALYMFDKRDELENVESLIVERYFDDFWCDTTFFYVGHKREIGARLLEKLFAFGGESGHDLKTNLDKFLIGRLLQAGWHSPTKVKISGIESAFKLLPEIRQSLLDYTEKKKWRLPKIYADFWILLYTDHSFRSAFLSREVRAVLEKKLQESEQTPMLVPLLWAMKPFVDYAEVKETAEKILFKITDSKELAAEEKARALVMLTVLERGNKEMAKTIKKKIHVLQSKDPSIFRKLLPKPARGSIPPSSKRAARNRANRGS